MQLTLELRSNRVPQQALLSERTTRMIAGDLRDLEHEAALETTKIFKETGISYPREDLESGMFNDLLSMTPVPPRMELDPNVEHWFPGETQKIDRLMHERRDILRKLMQKSKAWEESLADVAGDVSWIISINPDFLRSPEGDAAFRSGRMFEVAEEAGQATREQLGQQGNPWAWLEEDVMAFPDPVFFDAMFTADVTAEDVMTTPEYRGLRPWFVDDIEELLVAQWVYDHTGRSPWSRSMTAYTLMPLINSGNLEEEDWPEYHHVISAAEAVREYRQMNFHAQIDERPRQQHLIKGDR